MSHMETEHHYGDYVEVEGKHATCYIPLWALPEPSNRDNDGNLWLSPGDVIEYTGEFKNEDIYKIVTWKDGRLKRQIAPGFSDCTDWELVHVGRSHTVDYRVDDEEVQNDGGSPVVPGWPLSGGS